MRLRSYRVSVVTGLLLTLAVVIAAPDSVVAQQRIARIIENAPLYLLPDSQRSPLLFMEAGVEVRVLRTEGTWLNVTVSGSQWGDRTGYVEAKYVGPVSVQQKASPTTLPPRSAEPATRASLPESPTPHAAAAATPTPATKASSAAKPAAPITPPSEVSRPAITTTRLKEVKIRGYVTDMRSPTDFDIEDYRITRDEAFTLDFENATPDVTFQLHDVRVGVELEIKGLLNEVTGELKAKAIKVDLEQFKSLEQTAFVARVPEGIQLLDGSWAGELKADGQTIRVTDATKVLFKPTKREKKLAERATKSAEQPEGEAFEALRSLDQVTVGMAMTYHGKRDRETGKIIAERIEFSSNDLDDGEARMWRSLKTTVTPAQALKPGELKIDHAGKYKLLPDQGVQDYVASLGQRLIPAYQRDLAPDDPRKIPFQFHVVIDNSVNAFATPNGIVVVNSGMLELLENG